MAFICSHLTHTQAQFIYLFTLAFTVQLLLLNPLLTHHKELPEVDSNWVLYLPSYYEQSFKILFSAVHLHLNNIIKGTIPTFLFANSNFTQILVQAEWQVAIFSPDCLRNIAPQTYFCHIHQDKSVSSLLLMNLDFNFTVPCNCVQVGWKVAELVSVMKGFYLWSDCSWQRTNKYKAVTARALFLRYI